MSSGEAEAIKTLMAHVFSCAGAREHTMSILSPLRDELREIAWLASVISVLSVLGVGLAVTLALAL
jgi:hypothetical protein